MRHWRHVGLSAILPIAVLSGSIVGHWRRTGNPLGPGTVNGLHVPHLRGAHLAFINLAGSDLRYSCLADADLRAADLRDAHLCGADLTHADLKGANLMRTHLEEANLSRASLVSARLVEATLFAANLCGADLRGADLRGALMRGALYDDRTHWPAGFDPEERGAVRITSGTGARYRRANDPTGPRPAPGLPEGSLQDRRERLYRDNLCGSGARP
jgi:hypothetical protein